MAINRPKSSTWIFSVILGGLGIVSHFYLIQYVSAHKFWFVVAGFVLLLLGTVLRDF